MESIELFKLVMLLLFFTFKGLKLFNCGNLTCSQTNFLVLYLETLKYSKGNLIY